MTREEAIEEIKNYNKNYPSGLSKECRDYIIKALAQEPILDKIRADYENRLKADLVAILTEIQLEFEEEKLNTEHLHYDDLESAESYNTGIDNCIDTIQQKIDKYKAENEEK